MERLNRNRTRTAAVRAASMLALLAYGCSDRPLDAGGAPTTPVSDSSAGPVADASTTMDAAISDGGLAGDGATAQDGGGPRVDAGGLDGSVVSVCASDQSGRPLVRTAGGGRGY